MYSLATAATCKLSQVTDYPLHLGITEAGSFRTGTVKSAVGMGMLLWSGIGDTIRVSLSDDPVEGSASWIRYTKIPKPKAPRRQYHFVSLMRTATI